MGGYGIEKAEIETGDRWVFRAGWGFDEAIVRNLSGYANLISQLKAIRRIDKN
jgi:hypothetical protein